MRSARCFPIFYLLLSFLEAYFPSLPLSFLEAHFLFLKRTFLSFPPCLFVLRSLPIPFFEERVYWVVGFFLLHVLLPLYLLTSLSPAWSLVFSHESGSSSRQIGSSTPLVPPSTCRMNPSIWRMVPFIQRHGSLYTAHCSIHSMHSSLTRLVVSFSD